MEDRKIIELKNSQDISFSNIAQFAKVGEAILPSGLKVPKGNWIIIKNYLCDISSITDTDTDTASV